MECGFVGNPDIFGIGIRIGYYTQALAVWFASSFHYREAKVLRSVNNLFLVALTVVGLIYISNPSNFYAVEAFLLLYIGTTIAVLSLLDGTRFTSRFMEISNERMLTKMLIYIMGLFFLVWFWWAGVDHMRPTPCQRPSAPQSNAMPDAEQLREGTYGCWIVPGHLYGWIRTVMRVISLVILSRSALILSSSEPLELLHSLLIRKTKKAFLSEAAVARRQISSNPKGTMTMSAVKPTQQPQTQVIELRTVNNNTITTNNPSLPEASPERRSTCEIVPTTHPDERQFEFFFAVYTAEEYLDSVFSICETQKALLGHKRLVSIWSGYVQFYVPVQNPRQRSQLIPLKQCYHTIFTWYRKNQISTHLRWRIHIHLVGLSKGPLLIWPRLLYRVYQFANDKRPPDWRMVAIASDVQLSQIPLIRSTTKLWAFAAVKNLFVIILFIVQVEITIVWNHISGLNSLTSLGQLIPFILGVGGLLKVVWSKWRLVRSGVRENPDVSAPTEYEAAIETYLEWKKVYKAQLTPSSSEATQQMEPASIPESVPVVSSTPIDIPGVPRSGPTNEASEVLPHPSLQNEPLPEARPEQAEP